MADPRGTRPTRRPSHHFYRRDPAFRTGTGLCFDRQGPAGVHQTERMLGPWARLSLVPAIVPALEGVHDRLAAGTLVADVGCGAAVALTNVEIIDSPRRGAASRGRLLPRAHLRLLTRHDQAGPRRQRPSGTPLPTKGPGWSKRCAAPTRGAGNRRNPMLAMFLGFSIASCMSSALSEPGGAGLGTIGLPPRALQQLARDAGFTKFKAHDFEDPPTSTTRSGPDLPPRRGTPHRRHKGGGITVGRQRPASPVTVTDRSSV